MTGRDMLRIFVAVASAATIAPRASWALDPHRPLSAFASESWRSPDGLPGAWIRAIAQSADGYLWIGTQAGLARYGGGEMLHLQPERPSEHDPDVMALLAARDGTIWVAPARGAPACVRDGMFGGCFAQGQALPEDARIAHLHQDASGTIWIAAAAGVYRHAAGRLALVHPASAWGSSPASVVHHDNRAQRLWVGTATGLFSAPTAAAPAGRVPSLAPHLGPDGAAVTTPITGLFQTARGALWVTGERALLRVDGGSTTQLLTGETLPRRPSQVLEDRDGNVWIATRTGLLRIQPGPGDRLEPDRYTLFTHADGLPDDDVSAVFEDREGSLWVGTRGGGLVQIVDRTLDSRAGPPSVRELWISTIAEDAAGALWVGTRMGLTRWKDGREQTHTAANGLPSDEAHAVQPAPDGAVWVGTARGLARWRNGEIDVPFAIERGVSALYLDPSGVLWLGGVDGGVGRVHFGPRPRVEWLPLDGELAGQQLGEIRGMQHDDLGILWISAGGRLLREERGRLIRDRSPGAPTFGKVRAIQRDGDGTLWLGTGNGLVRRRQGAWRQFGPAEGLARADLFQVIADDHGYLWAGASHAVLRISRASLAEVDQGRRRTVEVVAFQSSDQSRETRAMRTRQPGVWRGRDGRLWFATARGVLSADPRRVRVNHTRPPVIIESASVDGRRARRGLANQFPPGSGALEFQFAAITLVDPRRAQHRYRLEGFDRDWVEAGTRRVAYYTNIRPGRYRFRVQGSNADGVWNEEGDTLELTLAPHFHQTVWFYASCLLAALGLGLAFHRMRVAQLRWRYAATFAERSRVARELHDSLLQGMAATLMRLKALRKRFAPRGSPESEDPVALEIREIEGVVATNIEETRHFVWNLRDQPAGEPATLGPALHHLVQRLSPAPGVEVEVELEGRAGTMVVPPHVRREVLQVAHEALANALRHGKPRHVAIGLRDSGAGDLTLSVHDDGAGFEPGQAPGVETGRFGLTGMRERAASLGTLTIESAPGQGTTVVLLVNCQELRQELRDE